MNINPCPFCQRATEPGSLLAPAVLKSTHFVGYAVVCGYCSAQGPVAVDEDDAVKEWNKINQQKQHIMQELNKLIEVFNAAPVIADENGRKILSPENGEHVDWAFNHLIPALVASMKAIRSVGLVPAPPVFVPNLPSHPSSAPGSVRWNCPACGQLNSGWSNECGRCNLLRTTASPLAPAATPSNAPQPAPAPAPSIHTPTAPPSTAGSAAVGDQTPGTPGTPEASPAIVHDMSLDTSVRLANKRGAGLARWRAEQKAKRLAAPPAAPQGTGENAPA